MTDLLTRTAAVEAPPAPAGEAFTGTVAEGLALAVAPSTGRFRPLADALGAVVAGQLLGHVTGGRCRADEVRCPAAGVVRRLLARPGQQVQRGQALLWLDGKAAAVAAATRAGTPTA